MFSQPRKVKYKKLKKGKLNHLESKANRLTFGNIGIKSVNSGILSFKQIESARKTIAKKMKRRGKLWTRIFPYLPVTSKSNESRMGKGKGAVTYWASKISSGNILFEICGVPKNVAVEALISAGAKLPVKIKIFD